MDVWRQTIPNRPMSSSNAPSLTVPPPVLLTWETGTISIRMAGSAVIFKSGRRCSEPWKFSSFDEFSEALQIGEPTSAAHRRKLVANFCSLAPPPFCEQAEAAALNGSPIGHLILQPILSKSLENVMIGAGNLERASGFRLAGARFAGS